MKKASKNANRKGPSMMKAAAPATSNVLDDPYPLPTYSSYSNRAAPMVVSFNLATIIDLVGRISQVVANFCGQDDYVHFDAYLAKMLPNADTELCQSLTLAVLAGA